MINARDRSRRPAAASCRTGAILSRRRPERDRFAQAPIICTFVETVRLEWREIRRLHGARHLHRCVCAGSDQGARCLQHLASQRWPGVSRRKPRTHQSRLRTVPASSPIPPAASCHSPCGRGSVRATFDRDVEKMRRDPNSNFSEEPESAPAFSSSVGRHGSDDLRRSKGRPDRGAANPKPPLRSRRSANLGHGCWPASEPLRQCSAGPERRSPGRTLQGNAASMPAGACRTPGPGKGSARKRSASARDARPRAIAPSRFAAAAPVGRSEPDRCRLLPDVGCR